MKIIKKISAAVLAACICAAFSISAFAAPEESTLTSEESVDTSVQAPKTSAQESSNEASNSYNTESGDNSEINYDFSDKTIGNAVLTANENIITDDGNYQFIAATTRDGNVFYIIIDKLKTTDNVYFLNQVDTFDLQALMNSDSEDGEPVKVGTDTSKKTEDFDEAVEDGEGETTEDTSNSMNTSLILLGGIAVLAVGSFAFFKVKKGGLGKKKSEPTMLDDDFDDEEINEDKES